MNITFKTNTKGYFGMSCPKCKAFFQVMKDTGQGKADSCFCPICGAEANRPDFLTLDQTNYIESRTINEGVKQIFGNLRSTKNLKVSGKNPPIHSYQEPDLPIEGVCILCNCKFASETTPIACPNCGGKLS